MNHLNQRIQSALDLFLHGCQTWAEILHNQHVLDEVENMKAEFQRISQMPHDEQTVGLVETMAVRILSDMDLAMKDLGMDGIKIVGTRH